MNIIFLRVVDFRTRMECLEKPDTIIEGVQYHEIPIVDEETLGITRSGSFRQMLLRILQQIPEEFMHEAVRIIGSWMNTASNSMHVFWMYFCIRMRELCSGTAVQVKIVSV